MKHCAHVYPPNWTVVTVHKGLSRGTKKHWKPCVKLRFSLCLSVSTVYFTQNSCLVYHTMFMWQIIQTCKNHKVDHKGGIQFQGTIQGSISYKTHTNRIKQTLINSIQLCHKCFISDVKLITSSPPTVLSEGPLFTHLPPLAHRPFLTFSGMRKRMPCTVLLFSF